MNKTEQFKKIFGEVMDEWACTYLNVDDVIPLAIAILEEEAKVWNTISDEEAIQEAIRRLKDEIIEPHSSTCLTCSHYKKLKEDQNWLKHPLCPCLDCEWRGPSPFSTSYYTEGPIKENL